MRLATLAAMTMLTGFAAVGPCLPALAQPAPPPPAGTPADDGGAAGPRERWHSAPDGPRPPMMGQMGPMHRMHERMIDPSLFALMYHPADRKLTPPDVQKIAEAILLWFGNHTWKVTEVGAAADGKIKFAYATADGSVVARFTMDSRTGKVVRTG